jgi:hypothetical protein
MGIQQELRNMQDNLRNAGWRIQWIPWQDPGKPEVIKPNNPLPLLGILMFIGGIALAVEKEPVWFGIGVSISGLAVAMLGVILSATKQYSTWVKIPDAKVIDREVGEALGDPESPSSTTWVYRLLCEFAYNGQVYRVTPESSHFTAFNTKRAVKKYLDERITFDGYCTLWVDPNNPLHAIFHKKKWWLG